MPHETTTKLPVAEHNLVLVGNPNVGKSVLFGLLTGNYVIVSNYPGTTVEIVSGNCRLNGTAMTVMDTPGINNLMPTSEDERATRNLLFNVEPDVVLQVADMKNLRRALVLSTQLQEMNMPFVLNLNMADEAERLNIKVNTQRLEEILGVPVATTVAIQRKGTEELKQRLGEPQKGQFRVRFDARIEESIERVMELIPQEVTRRRAIAIMLLAGDQDLEQWIESHYSVSVADAIRRETQELSKHYTQPLHYIISRERLDHIDSILHEVFQSETEEVRTTSETIGRIMVHPLWGGFVLIGVLYAMYEFVGVFGAGTAVDFLENTVFGEYINPFLTQIVNTVIPWEFVRSFIMGEYGIISMGFTYGAAIVLPIVCTFFIAFSILEDCGYLPRLSVMLDREFKLIGLNGKAILPMVLGLGCVTMAAMTTRILETRKERLLTMLLLALGIPCSAQLGVIGGMMASLSAGGIIIWFLVVIGVLFSVGYIAAKIIPGSVGDFVMELPPVRIPKFKNILIKTVARLEWYVKEVIPLFMLGTAFLFFLDEFALLGSIRSFASPVVEWLLGLPEQATDAFLVGFFRRDYGAAGLYHMQMQGILSPRQIVVSMVTITLFIPCIATVFVMLKEYGLKITGSMFLFIFPFAFVVGGILNQVLNYFNITF